MPRGILVDGSTIVTLSGQRIHTFAGCDLEYLEEVEGLRAGDVVAFSIARGSTREADYIRKAYSPTAQELALAREIKRAAHAH